MLVSRGEVEGPSMEVPIESVTPHAGSNKPYLPCNLHECVGNLVGERLGFPEQHLEAIRDGMSDSGRH